MTTTPPTTPTDAPAIPAPGLMTRGRPLLALARARVRA